MADLLVVESLEAAEGLDHVGPELFVGEASFLGLVLLDLVEEVASLRKFHDDNERVGGVVEEGFFVGDDVYVVDGGEDADLVDGVLLFFFAEFVHADLRIAVRKWVGEVGLPRVGILTFLRA